MARTPAAAPGSRLNIDPESITAGQMEELEDRLGDGGIAAWRRKPATLLIALLAVLDGQDEDELRALSVNELWERGRSKGDDDDTKGESATNEPK